MDSTIIPLRPGKVLLNSSRVTPENCPKVFEKWDKIWFKDVNVNPTTDNGPGSISPCSPYIGMNILSVDPNTVIVGEDQTNLIRVLEKEEFTVATIKMRHAQTLSGGLHCTTLDLIRTGSLESYC
jgi:arginine deiminase